MRSQIVFEFKGPRRRNSVRGKLAPSIIMKHGPTHRCIRSVIIEMGLCVKSMVHFMINIWPTEELRSSIISSRTIQDKTSWKMITAKGSIVHTKINPKKKCRGTDRQIKEGTTPIWCHKRRLRGVYDTEGSGIQPIHKILAGTSGSRSTPKWKD